MVRDKFYFGDEESDSAETNEDELEDMGMESEDLDEEEGADLGIEEDKEEEEV